MPTRLTFFEVAPFHGASRASVSPRKGTFAMRVLLVGAGGVGTAITKIAARRSFLDHMVVADYDVSRAEAAVAALAGSETRFSAARIDASDQGAITDLLRQERCDVLLNATDPRFVMPLFEAALAAGTHYLDMAMSLSSPHPERPYEECWIKLGDGQFDRAGAWEKAGRLALVGVGVEPGLSDVFARSSMARGLLSVRAPGRQRMETDRLLECDRRLRILGSGGDDGGVQVDDDPACQPSDLHAQPGKTAVPQQQRPHMPMDPPTTFAILHAACTGHCR
jgi:hypothetical protein